MVPSILKGYTMSKLLLVPVLFFAYAFFMLSNASAIDIDNKNLTTKTLLDQYRGDPENLKNAYQLITEVLNENPENAMAYVQLSRLIRKAGFMMRRNQKPVYRPGTLKQSREALEQALLLDPKLFDAYFTGVFLCLDEENIVQAREYASKLKQLSPNSQKSELALLNIAYHEKKFDKAIAIAESILATSKEPGVIDATYTNLIDVYTLQKKYKEADLAYREQMALQPNDPWLLDAYASFQYYYLENYDKTIEYGMQALNIMDFGMARKHVGLAYSGKAFKARAEKKYAEAIELYTLGIQYYPSARMYANLGDSYMELGEERNDKDLIEQARATLKKALQIDPEEGVARDYMERIKRKYPQSTERTGS